MAVIADHQRTTVWLLWASQGEYSDRSEWPLHAYGDEASAEYAVTRLSALYRLLSSRAREWREAEPEDAYLADDYDYEWAEKKALRSREGREFRRLYGAKPGGDGPVSLFTGGYDLNLTCAGIPVLHAEPRA